MTVIKTYPSRPAAVLRFTGDDHAGFLQSQGTADLRGPAGICRYSLWLDHRGLIQGDGFVFKESEEAMLLLSYASTANALVAKFERHIIADDVEIEDLTETYQILSMADSCLPEPFIAAGWETPGTGEFTTYINGMCFNGRRLVAGGLDCLVQIEAPLPDGIQVFSRVEAEQLRIQAGLPLIPADTGSGVLNPIEANLLSAVSFTKGCYLGQEVVARVHRLDRSSKRLVCFEGESLPAKLPLPLSRDNTVVGSLNSVVEFPAGIMGLGWLKSKISDGAQVFDEGPLLVRSAPES